MLPTASFVPVEQYLRSSYEPDAEYVDGAVEERRMGEYDHASWQQAIQRWFMLHDGRWGVRQRPELRVQVAPDRFRVPDVTILDRNAPREQIITHAPIAVFEVLSPEDSMARVLEKLADYDRMGIREIWVIDPASRNYFRYRAGSLERATHFGTPGEPMHFALQELEALLD